MPIILATGLWRPQGQPVIHEPCNNNKNRNQSGRISEICFKSLNHLTNKKPRLEPRSLKAQLCSASMRLPLRLWSLSQSGKLSIYSGEENPLLECSWRLLQGCALYHSAMWQEIWLCCLSQRGVFFFFSISGQVYPTLYICHLTCTIAIISSPGKFPIVCVIQLLIFKS